MQLLDALAADVIEIHGPFDHAERVLQATSGKGRRTVAVAHHTQPDEHHRVARMLGRWRHERHEERALAHADAVTAPAPAAAPRGCSAVRLGVEPAFRPDPSVRQGQQVVFAGEIDHSTGVFALPLAANLPNTLWPVRVIGHGRGVRGLQRAIRMFGLTERITIEPFMADRSRLATVFASAWCVVIPGPPTRGQLVALEAAATGAPVVAHEHAAIHALAPALTRSFPPDAGIEPLGEAIQAALRTPRDPRLGARLAEQNSWDRAFERELEELERLVR
jgi:glycosyltransferase involved in cell wall biosynthesis